MENYTRGMSEMALERMLEALVEADLHAAGRAENARWQGDPVSAGAWDDAGAAIYAMRLDVEYLYEQAKAHNERIAAL